MNIPQKSLVVAGGLVLFTLGFVSGRSTIGGRDRTDESGQKGIKFSAQRTRADEAGNQHRTKAGERVTAQGDKRFSRVLDMMTGGKLQIQGVNIDGQTLQPGDQVQAFFNLSDGEMGHLRDISRQRLREVQDHEQRMAVVTKFSESGITFDLPPDPEFAANQAAGFVDDLRRNFGPELAAVLEVSIKQSYRTFELPRHVDYNLKWRNDLADHPNAPPNILKLMGNSYDYQENINRNPDGTYMTGEQGQYLGGSGSSGTVNLNDNGPDAFRPRYHYLWERKMNVAR